jgi:mono/diheme cytochrome c family protein
MNRAFFLPTAVVALLLFTQDSSAQDATATFQAKIRPFLDAHCTDCHGPEVKKAGLRLDELKLDFADPKTLALWIKAHDKMAQGEMPPKKRARPPQAELDQVTHWLYQQLHAHSREKQEKEGRVVLRRLNCTEYENTLRDLLGVNVSVKSLLPEDNTAAGFDNVSAALDISAAHLLCYQQAAEKAILAAIPVAPQMPFSDKLTGRQMVEKSAMFKQELGRNCWLKDDTLVLHSRFPDHYHLIATALAPQAGRYRITVSAYAVGTGGLPLTMAMLCRPVRERGSHERRTCRDVFPATAHPSGGEGRGTIFETEFEMNRECNAWVQGWTLPERYEFFMKKVQPPLEKYQGPGLVVEWIKMEGPLGPWPPESYQRLFKDVPLKARSVAKAEAENKPIPKIPANRTESHWQNYDPLVPVSAKPKEDAERLIREFLPRALRGPVSEELQKHYVKLVHDRLDDKYTFADAMIFGYKTILTSTDFLFLREPGSPQLTEQKDFRSTRLDDHALANRLSYFLWSSMPDQELLTAAQKGDLTKPEHLRAQVERLLKDAKAHRFTENFTGQWLDLRKINDTMPDPQLYAEFDQFLLWSMPRETELYFEEILNNNLSLLEFIDSDWSMLNERLARHYGISDVVGQELRKVKLPEGSHRGGVMTHASVLKVTADGTRTSPVLRGKWVLERIIGKPPAPPPPDIPLFEPDIRGATTIREQLDKHRNTPACAACHNHIDPPGFALENFDAIGGWRDFYRATKVTKKGVVKGKRYYHGPDVEVGGVTPDGQAFKNIDDYKKILLEDKDQLARNLTAKLLIYATGADIQFADREVVEQIVARLRTKDYGFRELVHEVVQSRVFLQK